MSTRSRVIVGLLVPILVSTVARAQAQQRCPYGIDGTLSTNTATEQTSRLQNGATATCLAPKAAPPAVITTQKFKYETHTLKNRSTIAQCVTVNLSVTAGGAQSAAYLGTYDPANKGTNYLADSGGNASPTTPTQYSFNVPALASFVVVVNANSVGGTTTYHLDVTDCGAVVVTGVTPNAGPTAGGTAVTVKGSGFLAAPTISFGGTAATDIVLVDEATLTAKTPAHAEGPVDVLVTNADATMATLTSGFTFIPPSGTTIVLSSSVNPSVFGQPVSFSAALTSGAGTPAGTVKFFDGTTMIGSGALNGGGIAAFATSALAVGTHPIHAEYEGDAVFAAATSSAVDQSVNKASTTLALTSSKNPSAVGDSVVLSAAVAAKAPGAGTPTGAVVFVADGAPLGNGTLDNTGKATVSTSTLAAGAHTIEVSYAGDTKFLGSSATLTQTVGAASSSGSSGTSSGSSGTSSGSSGTSSGSSGTSSGSSGSSGADAGAGAAPSDASGDSGCGCRQTGANASELSLAALVAVIGAFLSRRARSKQR